MSSTAALSDASPPRVLVRDATEAGRWLDVFDVVSVEAGGEPGDDRAPELIRVRSSFLFEIGEELALVIERDGVASNARARVRAHTGPDDARITELEVTRDGAATA